MVGNLEVMGRLDSGSDYLMVDPEVWGEMDGELIQVLIAYVGISGKIQVLHEAKLVIFRIEDGETNYLAYPMPTARLGIKALVPWELARELGAELRNIPKFFPRRALRSDDKKWIQGKEVFDKKKLEESQREKILLVIQDAMAENKKLPASTRCTLKGAKFRIEIKADARPTNKPQYPICERFWEQVKQRGKEWIEKGWVKLWPPGSTPEWHSPLLAVKKVSGNKWNGDICLCMDFRAPNSVTEDPTYPVPLLREMLSRLVGKEIFSELDLVDVYHQIALDEESMECTTFTIPGVGKAYWVVLFFGAKGAVAFFQKIIEGALGEISVDIVIVIYVDNILVVSLEFKQHVREVEIVIQALTKAGLRLKPSKCKIGYSSIQFMGAVLDGSKRGIDPHKVKVFALMRRPKTGKEVQKVLGYLNFLRDFIPLYANIVGPMEGLRSAKVISNNLWKESGGEGVFELAKKVLSEAPILHNLDWTLEFFLEMDASQYGVGAILYQETEEGKRYVDFAAKAFNKAQQNYNAAKRELLAGLYAMNRWRPWLLFRKFTWGLDSKAVSFINTSTNRVVLDWINIFMDFDFEMRFKRGILNVLPHQLSHMYDMLQLDFGRGENLGDVEMGLLESGVKQVGSVVAVARGVGSRFDQSTKKFIQEKLLKEAPPVEERLKLVADTHKQSHMGFKMLFKMLWEDGYFWDLMWFDCEKEVAKCRPCQVFNVGRCGFQPMSTIVAKRPWDHIAMDLIGLLKCLERGFVFILIIIDVLTRFVVLKPLRTKEAKEIAYALVKVFANYGVPKMIQFDNEATFLSKIIEELRFVSGFEARNIMKYNPRQNGVVERFVAETKRVLMKWLHGDVSGREYYIPAVQMGLNNQILSRHNSCPFSLMFGRRMNGFEEFRDWAHDKVYSEEETEELLKELKTWGKEIWKIVSKESEAIGTRHTERGNKHERDKLQECVEHTLRKDQKITKNTKNICLKDKKEKKQINNAGFW